ncbi:transcriptional regulator (TetR family) protein [Bacillus sp. NRRL B-14911]|uniref:TetR/AcrR family transcriptional regulator n=1 Tax=Cytobacillus sp. T106 TaxID=3229227 RepID=UPI00006AC2A9|nr:transcriptional regulator (TetR family) protein [Bacillus sp. NRRL B-14911]OXT18087.1 TetR family transcriptional regulator [Bacillus sp. OG2]
MNKLDGFQRRKEQKQRHILEAAIKLFMDSGIHKVSISEIAKEAHVSQVTIYNYFESKHKLIHEVFLYYVDKASSEFEQLISSNDAFPDKVKKIIFNKKENANGIHEEFYQYMMKEYSVEGNYIDKIYEDKAIPLFKELFRQGHEQGYINPDLSFESMLFYVQMMKEYFQREEVYSKALPLTEDITNIFFYGIIGKKEDR